MSKATTTRNRHDKVAAIDLIVSVALKRPAQKEQHLCAHKAYDAKKAENWLALIQLACAHVLLNLAVLE